MQKNEVILAFCKELDNAREAGYIDTYSKMYSSVSIKGLLIIEQVNIRFGRKVTSDTIAKIKLYIETYYSFRVECSQFIEKNYDPKILIVRF